MPFIAVGLTAASACQSNPEPPPVETPSASATVSPSATASTAAAPTMPDTAKGTSRAAAKAFVRHYVDGVNYAMNTGDTSVMQKLAARDCSTCSAMADRIAEIYEAGGYLEGPGWTVETISYLPSGSTDTALVAATISIAAQTAVLSAGAQASESPQTRGNLDATLRSTESGWQLAQLEATQ